MSEDQEDQKEAAAAEKPQQQFEIQKIYLKDMSLEAPGTPAVFTQEWKPETNVHIATNAQQLQDNLHEVVLTVTVTTQCADKTAYLVEVKQAGVFSTNGVSEQQKAQLLGSYCPYILFPYAREAVSDLVSKGGFPQCLLGPVNFDALYAQHLQKQQQEALDKAGEDSPPASSATH